MGGSFSEDAIEQISDIRWVVVAPAPMAASYQAPQKKIGPWNAASPDIEVKQYVHSWVLSDPSRRSPISQKGVRKHLDES